MTINKTTPPQTSILEACERAMCIALYRATEARKAKDTADEARWLARLEWWTQQAIARLGEVA